MDWLTHSDPFVARGLLGRQRRVCGDPADQPSDRVPARWLAPPRTRIGRHHRQVAPARHRGGRRRAAAVDPRARTRASASPSSNCGCTSMCPCAAMPADAPQRAGRLARLRPACAHDARHAATAPQQLLAILVLGRMRDREAYPLLRRFRRAPRPHAVDARLVGAGADRPGPAAEGMAPDLIINGEWPGARSRHRPPASPDRVRAGAAGDGRTRPAGAPAAPDAGDRRRCALRCRPPLVARLLARQRPGNPDQRIALHRRPGRTLQACSPLLQPQRLARAPAGGPNARPRRRARRPASR